MGMIYYVIGKSSTGKDTIYRKLLENQELHLKPIVLYTTRPMRDGEQSGVQYHFTDEAGLEALAAAGKVIELRAYNTVQGVWKYFTADSAYIDLDVGSYIGIGVLKSFCSVRDYYGADRVVPIYIEVDDGERLQRALDREKEREEPQYAEMCRRYLSDDRDFQEENIVAAGISRRFVNDDLCRCLDEITTYVKSLEGKSGC